MKDGQQALDYLSAKASTRAAKTCRPRLVLLDLKMPRVDGIEVLTAIKADERTRRIPVVVMTSSQEESDVAKTYDLGVNSYVVKPVDFNALADVTRQAGYYWLAINRGADGLTACVRRLASRFRRFKPSQVPSTLDRERADAQHDHADVPERPAVVPEREVEAVQAVVEPALHAVQPVAPWPGPGSSCGST